jgi:broad specificity phosphatase PhoE
MMGGVTLVYLVQHGEKEPLPGDPGLTRTGRDQAVHTGRWLRGLEISALYSSPMRRARETAEGIASVTGLPIRRDAQLRERLNWDGSLPFDAFMARWARTMRDRDWTPADGEFYSAYFGFDPATAQECEDGTVIIRHAEGFDLALHPTEHIEPSLAFLHAGFRSRAMINAGLAFSL